MRLFLLVLMMILLPLRGGLGDAMAIDMAAAQFNATKNIAVSAGAARAGGLFDLKTSTHTEPDCHDALPPGAVAPHMPAPTTDAGDTGLGSVASEAADCGQCSACQSCHMLGVLALHHPSFACTAPLAKATAAHPLFKGVTLDPGLKPPIS